MVFYFTSIVPFKYTIYMGKDKFENEELIKYGLPEDIWFHVDNLSSAHVYLRLPPGKTITDIPGEVLEDCCQLVKQNSIQGCKIDNVPIVYTPWSNLKKTQSMEVGQVGFHNQKLVLKYKVAKKVNAIVNRLEKTKKELHPDLKAMQEQRLNEIRRDEKNEKERLKKEEMDKIAENKREEDIRTYKDFMEPEKMISNYDVQDNYEDDFM
uniref:NFACT RNA-binding domain-containing protein n=1 Tax=Arcella intermedia TaxID=1963864 RepID=A0A6B2LIL4_9EUKA